MILGCPPKNEEKPISSNDKIGFSSFLDAGLIRESAFASVPRRSVTD